MNDALDFSRCKTVPYEHQKIGVRLLLGRERNGRKNISAFLLADEVGGGKSKQVIDATQFAFEGGFVDAVVVIAPGFARSVWADPDPVLGEVAKHAWADVRNMICEYHARTPNIPFPHGLSRTLLWIVSNYEFIRRTDRLESLMRQLHGVRYWLVLDEAWNIKAWNAAQTKACEKLRACAVRITLLNGSPIAHSPRDLFSQMNTMDPRILSCVGKRGKPIISLFDARYVIKGGFKGKQILDWRDLDKLQALVKPYAIRRLTRECFDLPPELPPVILDAPLTDANWKIYRQMRDEMVAWLDSGEFSLAGQAVVKALRLSQITSGFLGGLSQADDAARVQALDVGPKEIGNEKLSVFVSWLEHQDIPKLLVWCRFRAEIERTARVLQAAGYRVFKLWGGQSPEDREAAKLALAPGGDPEPAIVVGHAQAGGAALNLAGASVAVYLSNDFSLKSRVQSKGRIDRPGQRNPITFVDVVATGPAPHCAKTIDHAILKALLEKKNIAEWTASVWRQALMQE